MLVCVAILVDLCAVDLGCRFAACASVYCEFLGLVFGLWFLVVAGFRIWRF